jgi:hypothetical protein
VPFSEIQPQIVMAGLDPAIYAAPLAAIVVA